MNMAKRIERKLIEAFSPQYIQVRDDSHLHAGHAAAPQKGESHFFVEIHAESFKGKSLVASHRMIYAILEHEMHDSIHALELKVKR